MTRAIPTLFPTGEADFAAPRIHKVIIGALFKHHTMYKDGCFTKHPRIRYTEMRWRTLQAATSTYISMPQMQGLQFRNLGTWLAVRERISQVWL